MSTVNQHTVLIADDEHHIRFVLGDKLRKAGLTVIEATDGEEALTLALTHIPSLIISDLQMPGDADLAGENDAFADDGASGEAGLRADQGVFIDRAGVADLN